MHGNKDKYKVTIAFYCENNKVSKHRDRNNDLDIHVLDGTAGYPPECVCGRKGRSN